MTDRPDHPDHPDLARLVDGLASPDPVVRDDQSYAALARLVGSGDLPLGDLAWLGDAMVQRLGHERVEARTFAPLILDCLVEAGHFVESWVPAVTAWYVSEQDTRGHDVELGWLHAVAHGADFYGACGARAVGDPAELLAALAARMVVPTDHVWRDQEDDRVAKAAALVLAHPGTGAALAADWLDPVAELFASGRPGPVPAEATNTMRTLRSLHVALGEQVLHRREPVTVPHADVVRSRMSRLLAEVTPWFWRPVTDR